MTGRVFLEYRVEHRVTPHPMRGPFAGIPGYRVAARYDVEYRVAARYDVVAGSSV